VMDGIQFDDSLRGAIARALKQFQKNPSGVATEQCEIDSVPELSSAVRGWDSRTDFAAYGRSLRLDRASRTNARAVRQSGTVLAQQT
jgi:hypothetical protein